MDTLAPLFAVISMEPSLRRRITVAAFDAPTPYSRVSPASTFCAGRLLSTTARMTTSSPMRAMSASVFAVTAGCAKRPRGCATSHPSTRSALASSPGSPAPRMDAVSTRRAVETTKRATLTNESIRIASG